MAPTEQQLRQKKAAQISGKKKQSKARIQRYISNVTQSQIKELGPKHTLLLKGRKTSNNMNKLLQELRSIQAPASKLLNKKNPIDIFSNSAGISSDSSSGDGVSSLEFLMTKNDCHLFGMATHNKKRPNNLILGRVFNNQLLDSVELGVQYYKSSIHSSHVSSSGSSSTKGSPDDYPKNVSGVNHC
jgi:ribosome production factor 2